jgi:hypothetical protein
MREAASVWASVRIQGQPTADEKSFDVDIIICAHWKLLTEEYPGRYIVIATTNVKHLSRFAQAQQWQDIKQRGIGLCSRSVSERVAGGNLRLTSLEF